MVFYLQLFLILEIHSSFLTTSLFITLLSSLKSTWVVANFPIPNLSTLVFELLKSLRIVFNLSISYLSTLDFKLAKSAFLAKDDVSTAAAFFKSSFVA